MDVRIEAESANISLHTGNAKVGELSSRPHLAGLWFADVLTPNQELSLQVHSLNSPNGPPTLRNKLNAVGATLA